jgi:uncharacterized protein
MKFLVDQMMGKLCKWLLILGYDTELNKETDFRKVKQICLEENRIFITKSIKNFKLAGLNNALLVNSDNSNKQLEIMITFLNLKLNLNLNLNLFSRCLECNTPVIKIEKENLMNRVPEKSYEFNDEFNECPKCKKIYWKGTHYINTIKKLEKIMQKD